MQGRVEAARGALDAALQRRSAVALEIATAGLLDPASAVLVADSAHRARAAPAGTEEQAESDLSRALAASFAELADPVDPAESAADPTAAHPAPADPAAGPAAADPVAADPAAPAATERLAASDAAFPSVHLSSDDAGGALFAELAEAARRVQLARRFHNDAVRAARALRRHRLVRWFRLAGRSPMPRPVDFDDSEPPGLRG
jgi:hypothetical protein